jgi:hypothetical protein
MDTQRVLAVLRALELEGVRYKVVGGVAINFHGLARATEDLDLFVAPDPANVARLKVALRSIFNDPRIDEISSEDLSGPYPAIQYVPPDGTFSIDLLARLGEAFRYDDIEAEERSIQGVRVAVATPRMLYRMKKDTIRLQDRADAERLKERFNLEED